LPKRIWTFAVIAAWVAGTLSCSDSSDTPLGSEFVGNGLGSRPGAVFEDSIAITSGDTVVTFHSLIEDATYLEVGREDGYERFTLLKINFAGAGSDTLRTVSRATLRFNIIDNDDYADVIRARFYELGSTYDEGDSVAALDTTQVIPDPNSGAADRNLSFGTLVYDLPTDLVEAWIRGDSDHMGIAIVFVEESDKVMGLNSLETATSSLRPSIQANFTDGEFTNFPASDDGILVQPTAATTNLIISDGYVRRIHFRIDLSALNDSAAVHEARIVFRFVPGTVFGKNQQVILYAPKSGDPDAVLFRTGQLVTTRTLDVDSGVLELPLTNALLAVLSGALADNGFVLRFVNENTEVRQAEFYPGSDPTNRPKVFITYSTPAEFDS